MANSSPVKVDVYLGRSDTDTENSYTCYFNQHFFIIFYSCWSKLEI